jgi:hypothetical protein
VMQVNNMITLGSENRNNDLHNLLLGTDYCNINGS